MDLIYAGRYTEVCDYKWDDYTQQPANKLDLPSGIWYVDTGSIPEFFSIITNMFNRYKKYVVVSPSCDFCVCEQRYNHPAYDFEKWVGLQLTPGHGYNDLHMAARIDRARCSESHKYSIKCWSYTAATFPEIPNQVVKWFLVNCEVKDERLIPIPFGIFGNKKQLDNANLIDIRRQLSKERKKLLYCNFQFYTTDRYRIFKYLKDRFPDRITFKHECSFDEFLDDLATHKFVLCPTGNGYDCYRTLETIYMGAIPILEHKMGAVEPYLELAYPFLIMPSLFAIDPVMLDTVYEKIINEWYPLEEMRVGGPPRQREDRTDLTRALWPYWRDKIEACRSLL